MDIRTEGTAEHTRVAIAGDLDIYCAMEAYETLRLSLAEARHVELDLADVEMLDGAGLQVLIAVKREAVRTGKTLALSRHNAAVVEVIELCQLSGFFGDPIVLRAEWETR